MSTGDAVQPAVSPRASGDGRLAWLEALKAFALAGILLNHTVEAFGPGPWFTNPTNTWPALAARLHGWFPPAGGPLPRWFQFLGWLGDSGPGVFILASGFGLTLAALRRPEQVRSWTVFLRRRLSRIFPLYIAMHVVVLALALAVPGSAARLDDPRTLLSLAGLRFTPGLFFYLVPAWWFVWLILQLYAVFPLSLRLLQRVGTARFLGVAIAFTLACRTGGLLFSGHLYYWMTGLFFGTRFAEFAVGMALAAWLVAHRRPLARPFAPATVLMAGLPLYLAGLVASWFWWGSLVSNLLVTAGMAGLFYGLWHLLRRIPGAEAGLLWAGALAFPVFLLHQPLIQWTGAFFPAPGPHLVAAAGLVVLSFPAGRLIERAAATVVRWPRTMPVERWRRASAVASLGLLLALLAQPVLVGGEWSQRAWALLLGLGLLVLAGAEAAEGAGSFFATALRWSAASAALVQLFILPVPAGFSALGVGVATGMTAALLRRLRGGRIIPLAGGIAVALVLWSAAELALARLAPVEAGDWGEKPALQADSDRTYGLRPERVTHLRYNDYDYTVRTNRLGLPGPEITARPDSTTLRILVAGDAFTMPEGLPYEQGYVARLQRGLAKCLAPRQVQVIDAGVTGYGPGESLPQLRALVAALRPDVVVYQFFINEFGEAMLTPAERLASIGLTHPGSRRGYFWSRSQVAARMARAGDALWEHLTGQPAQWRFGRALLAYYRSGPNVLYDARHRAALAGDLAAMRELADSAGARFALLFVPGAVAVEPPESLSYFPRGVELTDAGGYDLDRPWNELKPMTDSLDIPALDLTPALRRRGAMTYQPGAWHWTILGHRAAARALAGWLAREGWLPERCGEANP